LNSLPVTAGFFVTVRARMLGRSMAASIWREREPELRAMAGTMTADKIAQHYGITRGALSYQASRFGISLAAPADIRRRDCGGGRHGSGSSAGRNCRHWPRP
jgi:hypothetical protein